MLLLGSGDRVFLYVPAYPRYGYGQTIKVTGTLQRRVINKEFVMLLLANPRIDLVRSKENLLFQVLSSFRLATTDLFYYTLPPRSSSLLLGIVFGIKQQTDDRFANALRNSGVLHVIVASGMNVAMVGGFLSSIFTLIFRRQIALVFTILSILLYALLAGFDPPIVRAASMGSIALVAQILGRQRLAAYGLFLTGFFMLFVQPFLLFDVGFQLSFLATLGLITLRPLFTLGRKGVVGKVVGESDLATTIAAQLATLPILLSNFGTYSLVSILVNGLVLWTVPLVMVLGGVASIVGLAFPLVGQALLFVTLPFLWYFETLVLFFGSSDSGVHLEAFSPLIGFGYYLLLGAVVYAVYLKKRA